MDYILVTSGTVIVNGNAIIGNNCNLSPGVTIGQVSEGKKKGSPIIQDNVWDWYKFLFVLEISQ